MGLQVGDQVSVKNTLYGETFIRTFSHKAINGNLMCIRHGYEESYLNRFYYKIDRWKYVSLISGSERLMPRRIQRGEY